MAALLAAASETTSPVSLVTMHSQGVALIYGTNEVAIETAHRLADHLDVTVLLTKPDDVVPPRINAFPVLKGTIVGAKGYLGAFHLRIDDYAQPLPSSRASLVFGQSRDGAVSTCDLLIDLSGGLPLFPAAYLRNGYFRADPRDPKSVERILFEASHMIGDFDKPRFITFSEKLCAHSRSQITGCTRCLDLCPAGAITPAGDHVAIDPQICAGCGNCASVCPTGAASYALPTADVLMRKLRKLMLAYSAAGGTNGVVLFHDRDHGGALIDASARFGNGLPAHILPVEVNEITQVGFEAIAAIFAYGAAGAHFLTRAKPRHDMSGLHRTIGLAHAILDGLGYGKCIVSVVETDDPEALRHALDHLALGSPAPSPASFLPMGSKRSILEFATRELQRVAPHPVDLVPLPEGAPFGGLKVDTEGCTLCLSCVSVCPTSALTDHPDRPMLRFAENLCVQCGLCAATCPEKVIKLEPQIDFRTWDRGRRTIKEEEPFHCTSCGKPFGTKSSIDKVIARLADKHWMFSGAEGAARLRILTMCEDCRVAAVVNEAFDPHAPPPRPMVRTTEDYLRERAERKGEKGG
jgi:ferredoxin